MIRLQQCPRCKGAVVENGLAAHDAPYCINCGWRRVKVPSDIQAEVSAYHGSPYIGNPYQHRLIGTGKPALSGWERLKRKRAREAAAKETKFLGPDEDQKQQGNRIMAMALSDQLGLPMMACLKQLTSAS